MRITVKVNTSSHEELVEKISAGSFKIKFNAVREKGEANAKLIKILAKYFKTSPQSIRIISGFSSSKKIIEIE